MFDNSMWDALISGLMQSTLSKRLIWEPVEIRQGTLRAQTESAMYDISSKDGDGRQPYSLTVSKAVPGPRIKFRAVDTIGSNSRDFPYAAHLLDQLWQAAKMSNNSEEVLIDLLEELRNL